MRRRTRLGLILAGALVVTVFAPAPVAPRALGLPITIPSHHELPLHLRPLAFFPNDLSFDDDNFGIRPGHMYVADPVDVVSGVFSFSVTDLSVHGRGLNFSFTRTYNSADDWWASNSPMAAGWSHSYDWTLDDDSCGAFFRLRRGDGGRGILPEDISFGSDGQPFATRTYTLVTHDQTTYTFANPILVDTGGNPPCYQYYQYRLTRISDRAGDALTFAYDIVGVPGEQYARLSTITDTLGRVYHLSYISGCLGPLGIVARLDDPFGRSLIFGNNAYCTLASATDVLGHTTTYTPTSAGSRYIASITDPDGRIRPQNTYSTDGKARVVRQVDGEGNATTFTYSDTTYVNTVTDPRGTVTTYSTIAQCGTLTTWIRAVATESSAGSTTTYEYDMGCRRNAIVDRLGGRTDFAYTDHLFLASRTDASVGGLRPVTTYQYDGNWNLTRVTDPRGLTTDRTYDQTTGVLLTERRQIDTTTYATTAYTYADALNKLSPTTITSPLGHATALAYDTSANLNRRTDPDSVTTTYGYDALGRQTSVTDAENHTTTTAYDNADRVTSVTDPLLHSTAYAYDGAGNRTSVTDRDGHVTSYAYDGNSRLRAVQQHPNPSTTYTTSIARDGNGNVTRLTEGNGNMRDSAYDPFDRVISTTEYTGTSQGTLTTTYARDALGNVQTRSTPDGVTISYAYDALSRLTSVSATGISIGYTYDLAGNRTQMTDGTGTTNYVYDGAGRLISVAAPAGTVAYAYDLEGNRTRVTYPGAGDVTYTYTAAGRMRTVTDWAGRLSQYAYRPSGLVSTLTYPNGMVATYAYDAGGRLTQLVNAIGTTTITSHNYTLDPEGNRTQMSEFVSGITALGGTDVINYTYDGLNRLTGSTGAVSESFSFDGASNITARTGPAATNNYDAADRLQSDGTLVYGWSKADQLVSRGAPPVTPQVTFRDQSNANNGGGATTLVIARPAGAQPGDMLLAFVYIESSTATIDTPVGWTALAGVTVGGSHMGAIFCRIATGSDPASWTLTFGTHYDRIFEEFYPNVAPAEGAILAYSNVNTATPLSPATASAAGGVSAIPAAGALTLGYPNELVVASYGQNASSTAAVPTGWTSRTSYAPGATAGVLKVEERRYAAVGSSDQVQWSSPTSNSWVSFGVALVPTSPPPPTGDSFAFDPLGRLTSSIVAGTTTNYGYSGDGLLSSRNGNGYLWDRSWDPAPLLAVGGEHLMQGDSPLYVIHANGTTTTLATDGIGSVRAEVASSGSVSFAARYSAYGAQLAHSGLSSAPLGYAGELADNSGLVYLRARWYDPRTARFLSSDPTTEDPATQALQNRFAYGAGNPVIYGDPRGLAAEDKILSGPGPGGPPSGGGYPGWLDRLRQLIDRFLGRGQSAAAEAQIPFHPELAAEKFGRHGAVMGFESEADYVAAAQRVIQRGKGVLSYERAPGDVAYYDPSTNEFVVVQDGTIRTYFEPDRGMAYWIDDITRHGGVP